MKNLPPIDLFSTPREKHIRSLLYYGEFLGLLDFDDGWSTRVYPLLLDYISKISASGITLSCEEVENRVHVILSASETSEENIQDVFEISRDLQKNYELSPVTQYVDQNFTSAKNPLPVKCETPEETTLSYPRSVVQKHASDLQTHLYDIKSIENRTSILRNMGSSSRIKNIIQEQEEIQKITRHAIAEMQAAMPEVVAMQYFLLSQLQHTTPTILTIKREDFPKEESENTKNHNSEIIDRLKNLEESIQVLSGKSYQSDNKDNTKEYQKRKEEEEENKEKMEIQQNRNYLDSIELSTGEEEEMEKIISENILRFQTSLKEYELQECSFIEEYLKQENLGRKGWIDTRKYIFSGLSIDVRTDIIGVAEKDGQKTCTLHIEFTLRHIPWLSSGHGGDMMKSLTSEVDLTADSYGATDIDYAFKEILLLKKHLSEFKNIYNFSNITIARDIIEKELVSKMSEKQTEKTGVPILDDIQKRKDFFSEYDTIHQLESSIKSRWIFEKYASDTSGEIDFLKEIQSIFFTDLSYEGYTYKQHKDFLISMKEYIDNKRVAEEIFSTNEIPMLEKIPTNNIMHSDEHRVKRKKNNMYAKTTSHNTYRYNYRPLKGFFLHSNDNHFGRETDEVLGWRKKEMGPDSYVRYELDLHKIPKLMTHIFPKLNSFYHIASLSDKTDSFLFTESLNGEKLEQAFFVRMSGKLQWDKSLKCFKPHFFPIIIPANNKGKDILQLNQLLKVRIKEAIEEYNLEQNQ